MSDDTHNNNKTLEYPENTVKKIPIDQIEPDAEQIRKEFRDDELLALTASIKEQGLLQPIQITTGKNGKYKIISGERRYKAHKELGLKRIKALYVTDSTNKEIGIIDNLLHEMYNSMELALAYQQLRDLMGNEATDDKVAAKVGKSRSLVVNYLSLLKLPEAIKKMALEDSCVPFRYLKKIASAKCSPDEKIKEYQLLHAKYTSKEERNAKESKNSAAETAQKTNRETRVVVAATKKISAMNASLNKITSFSLVDEEALNSLNQALKEVTSLLEKELPK